MSVSKPSHAALHPGPGYRIRHRIERPDPEACAEFSAFATPDVSDTMNRLYTMEAAIHALTGPHLRILGPALTVKTYPGDNLMVHKALDIAEPGDVVVVDTGRDRRTAAMGDLVSTKARHRGVAGFVIDGMVRDLPGIIALGDFPVYGTGVTPVGPLQRGPGEIGYPISCGGIVVHPGDLVVGDLNGVVVVPRASVPDILERMRKRASKDLAYQEAVARGDFSNAWVDSILDEGGVLHEDRPS